MLKSKENTPRIWWRMEISVSKFYRGNMRLPLHKVLNETYGTKTLTYNKTAKNCTRDTTQIVKDTFPFICAVNKLRLKHLYDMTKSVSIYFS